MGFRDKRSTRHYVDQTKGRPRHKVNLDKISTKPLILQKEYDKVEERSESEKGNMRKKRERERERKGQRARRESEKRE